MSRRKQTAMPVPATQAEAAALLARYVSAERRGLELRLGYQIQIDKLTAERDAINGLVEADQQQRFAALKAWWEAGGKTLAGKRRSAELAGVSIGIRLTPPAVKFAKGWTAKRVLDELLGWLAGDFVRTKYELDKGAIAAALTAPPSKRTTKEARHNFRVLSEKLELSVVQTDELFIDCWIDAAEVKDGPKADLAGKED